MTQPHTPSPEPRWDDARLERLLVESGRRTRGLSPQRRERVLQVLLAEQARLQQEEVRRRPEQRSGAAIAWLRLAAGALALAAGLSLVLSAYLLFGGARLPAEATLSGVASVNERRYGVLGVQWALARAEQSYSAYPLARGDEILARTSVTVTFADGSAAVLPPGAQAKVLEEGTGLFLLAGEVESIVQPRRPDAPFRVETAFGSMVVRGTVFRVQLQPDAATELTDEGVVVVSNALESRAVITGEQVRVASAEPLRSELQAPRARFSSRLPDRILTNEDALAFQAIIYPSAVLVIYEANTQAELGRFNADNAGRIVGTLPLAEGMWTLQLRQVSPDGRQSALSTPIRAEVDRTPPALQVESVARQGARLRVVGRAEREATVSVNGIGVLLQADGQFETVLDQARGAVTVLARDPAGNETTIVKVVE